MFAEQPGLLPNNILAFITGMGGYDGVDPAPCQDGSTYPQSNPNRAVVAKTGLMRASRSVEGTRRSAREAVTMLGVRVEGDELEFGPTAVSAPSSAISDRYKTVKPRRVGARIPVTVIKALAADPTVRHSERGRELLRLVMQHAIVPDEWAAMVEAVPAHRTAMIVKLAESLSLTWQQFADELRRR